MRRSSTNVGKYRVGERHVAVLHPLYRKEDTDNKPLVIFIPGHGAEATQGITPTYCDRMNFALADAGYPVLCIDAGSPAPTGQNKWGNAVAMTAINDAINWGQSASGLGAKAGKVVMTGVSLGGLNSFVFALLNPTQVAGVAAYIPAVSMRDHYAAGGYADDEMNAAYNVTDLDGLTTAVAGREPNANAAGFAGIPIKIWGSDNDGILSDAQISFAAAVPIGSRVSLGNVGHDPTPTNPSEVVAFINALF